jgi:hypothetical protein
MVLAIFASMPDKFWFVGNSPKMWIGDIESDLSYKASIAQQLEHYAYMIEENSRCMVICNKRLKCSMLIAWGTLLIGGCAVVIWIWQFR